MTKYIHTTQSTIIKNPGKEFDVENRFWQGCPTIARTRKGRLYAGWYTGGCQEPSLFNYNLLVRSDDEGLNWSKPILVLNSVPQELLQSLDIQLWIDPAGRLWVFYTQRNYNYLPQSNPAHLNLWAIRCDDPDADELQWCDPFFIGCGFLRCQPTVLSDGRIFLPAYDWTGEKYQYFVSRDNGETFERCFAGKKVPTHFDEVMFLERQDRSILLFARTNTGFLGKCESFDGGKSWTDGENTDIPNPSSRFCLLRLKSGRVLLINQMDSKKRTAMTALLSEDDGKTFPYALLLDNGENNSYPDAVQSKDGTIYLIWDRGRQSAREIVCARITEDDILAGKIVDDGSYCYNIVSKAFLPAKRKNEEPLRSFAEAEKSFISCFIAEVYRDDGVVENLRAAVERSIQAAKTLFTGQ